MKRSSAYMDIDKLVAKIPGSPAAKAFALSIACVAVCAVPVFGKSSSSERQGEALFSQEKPERIAAGQERQRRQERQGREGPSTS
jgi:hypothetical protein